MLLIVVSEGCARYLEEEWVKHGVPRFVRRLSAAGRLRIDCYF